MRTVPYKSVLDRLAGYLGEADGIGSEDAILLNNKVNLFVRLGWEFYWWPELTVIERRTFRPGWNAGTDYPAPTATQPTEVFFPTPGAGQFPTDVGNYYQALQENTGQPCANLVNGAWVTKGAYWALSCSSYSADLWQANASYGVCGDGSGLPSMIQLPADGRYYQCITANNDAVFDPTKWGVLTPFTRSIDYEQVDGNDVALTPLGEVRFIWTRDPEYDRYAQKCPFRLRSDFVQVLGTANVVWVEFRLRPTVYTNTVYDITASYGMGVQLYDPVTGDNWTSNQAISPGQSPSVASDNWDLVPFPYIFAEYVAQSSYAQLVNREEMAGAQGGQPESFSVMNTAGYPLLQMELDKIERQQGQVRQLNVRSGRGTMGGWWYRH